MPNIDLRADSGDVRPDAPWLVVRAMCAPEDRERQNRERTRVRKLVRAKQPDATNGARQLVAGAETGSTAAKILEYMLALDAHHPPASKAWAFSLTRKNLQVSLGLPLDRLPPTDAPDHRRGDVYARLQAPGNSPNLSDGRLRQIWQRFAPVAHLWLAWTLLEDRYGPAAAIDTGHAELAGSQVQCTEVGAIAFSAQHFPTFVALSQAILARASTVYLRSRTAERRIPAIDPKRAYRVVLPESKRVAETYDPAPIPPALLGMVRSEAA